MFISCTQCFVLHIVKCTHQQGDMFTKSQWGRCGGFLLVVIYSWQLILRYSWFHIKGTWSVHSFNGDYLSISQGTGSCEYLFHEIPGSRGKKSAVFKEPRQTEMADPQPPAVRWTSVDCRWSAHPSAPRCDLRGSSCWHACEWGRRPCVQWTSPWGCLRWVRCTAWWCQRPPQSSCREYIDWEWSELYKQRCGEFSQIKTFNLNL